MLNWIETTAPQSARYKSFRLMDGDTWRGTVWDSVVGVSWAYFPNGAGNGYIGESCDSIETGKSRTLAAHQERSRQAA